MRCAEGWRLVALLAFLSALAAGCTRVVTGMPSAASPHAVTSSATAAPGSVTADAPRGTARDPTPAPRPAPVALEPDVLADECLLDAGQFAALLGRPVGAPEQSVVRRGDGSRSSSCYVGPAEGDPAPLAAINVYRVRTGTPAQFVSKGAAGGRRLTGVGVAAAVLDTVAGPTLQVASQRFVLTIVVQGREPGDAAWRAAGRAALARLPS
jgi:hypothetical protein